MPVTTVTFIKHILIICTVSSYDTSSSALLGRTQRIIYVTTTARRHKYRYPEQITVGTWHCHPPNPAVSICSHNTFRCLIINILASVLRIITGLLRLLIRSECMFILFFFSNSLFVKCSKRSMIQYVIKILYDHYYANRMMFCKHLVITHFKTLLLFWRVLRSLKNKFNTFYIMTRLSNRFRYNYSRTSDYPSVTGQEHSPG